MRLRLAVATMIVAVMILPGFAHAQMPWIGVFFDSAFQEMAENSPDSGHLGQLYIALVDANAFVSGVEFKVEYPTEIVHLSDFDKQVAIGTTATGFSQGWAIPPNGFSAVYVCGVQFMWTVIGCQNFNSEIVVVPHPDTGFLGFTDFPSYTPIPAVGMTSLVCATVPVEDTTWGQIKSLYSE